MQSNSITAEHSTHYLTIEGLKTCLAPGDSYCWYSEREDSEKSLMPLAKRNGITAKHSTHNPTIEGLNPIGKMREPLLVQRERRW